ncbi:cytochrome P450 [Scopulibacillus darangshiensis]|nr:cytochrome P450 [Scopulibacillus darangshiensis]
MGASRLNSFPDEFFVNPYPFYRELHSNGPVQRGTLIKHDGWVVTGYKEALHILKHPHFKTRMPIPKDSKDNKRLIRIQKNMMLFKNPPDHTRIRSLVSKAFTPHAIEAVRTSIEETAHQLLVRVQDAGEMEVKSDFAFPLAMATIARILGVSPQDYPQFRKRADLLIRTTDLTRTEKTLDGEAAASELLDYFRSLVKYRLHYPEDDLISKLVGEADDGDKLDEDELLATCILLIIAGHETTVNLIGNGVVSLLKNPDQLIKLKEEPSLIRSAVEECLRFESPTQLTARFAAEDTEVGGTTIKSGEQIYLLLGAANRDPMRFTDPDIFDITREPNPHLAFGTGNHFCLGSALARLEAQIAINTLLQQLPNLRLENDRLQWRRLFGFRSLEELPISFG